MFRVKENPDGNVSKYKAKLVDKGFHQVGEFDYSETFSRVVKPINVMFLPWIYLKIGPSNNWMSIMHFLMDF